MFKNRAKALAAFFTAYMLILAGWSLPALAQQGSNSSYVAGERNVAWYAFGLGSVQGAFITSGNSSTGSQTITVCPGFRTLPDGRQVNLFGGIRGSGFVPITVDAQSSTNVETVTPTALTYTTPQQLQGANQAVPCAQITATFSFTHANSQNTHQVISGDGGLQEAINDAFLAGGGIVTVGPESTVTNTQLAAAVAFPTVSIADKRAGVPRYWNITPTGLALAVPTTLTAQAACDATHQFCSDATVAGSASYAGGSLFGCVAYVDIAGNEGPCSLTASFTDVSAKAIDVAAPAASPGAVGYVVYLSLDAGTYAQAYQIPSTSLNCTLTTLETILPACAVANTTFGQSASVFGKNALFNGGSQITTIALNTGLHFTKLASTVQTTASLTPMTNSSVTYSYAPSSRVGGCPGTSSWNATQEIAAGGISASSSTGIPMSMGTWTIPAGCFNFIGAEFRVSGKITWTDGGAADAMKVIVAWDASGTNTTTVPTTLCNIANSHTNAAAAQTGYYSCTVRILTTGATGTALVNGSGFFDIATGAAGVLIGGANDTAVAASGSINLLVPARISVRFSDTGATVTGAQPLEGTLEVLN